MAYSADRTPLELTALTSLASDDTIIVGDTSDVSEVAKSITKANLITTLGITAAPVDSVNTQTGAVVLDADDISDAATTNKFTTAGDISKLAGIEASADVTDTANVTAAGALMDSEVTNLAQVKAFDSADYATAAQGTLAGTALQPNTDITVTDIQVTGEIYADAEVDDGNSSTADTIDWTTGNYHKSTMTGNCTYTFTAPTGTARVQLKLVQDATGSRVATWPASVKWPGGTAPTLTTAANAVDIITFYYDGTSFYAVETLNFS